MCFIFYANQILHYIRIAFSSRNSSLYSKILIDFTQFNLFHTLSQTQFPYVKTYLEAAKTKLTKNYKGMNPKHITTTVGLNIGQIDISGIRLSFWDLGGQNELQSLWDKYYQESHAIIYVVDSHDRERMEESKAVFGM